MIFIGADRTDIHGCISDIAEGSQNTSAGCYIGKAAEERQKAEVKLE
jgi:hypothetical protein